MVASNAPLVPKDTKDSNSLQRVIVRLPLWMYRQANSYSALEGGRGPRIAIEHALQALFKSKTRRNNSKAA